MNHVKSIGGKSGLCSRSNKSTHGHTKTHQSHDLIPTNLTMGDDQAITGLCPKNTNNVSSARYQGHTSGSADPQREPNANTSQSITVI
jgi:hypothetical protein